MHTASGCGDHAVQTAVTLALVDWMVGVDMCRLVKPACCHSDAGTPLYVCLLYCLAFHCTGKPRSSCGLGTWQGQYQTIKIDMIISNRLLIAPQPQEDLESKGI